MGTFVAALLVCKFLLIILSLPGIEFVCKILKCSRYLSVFYSDFVCVNVSKEFDLCTQGAFTRD